MTKPSRVGFFYFLTTAVIAIVFALCLGYSGMASVFASEETGEPAVTEQPVNTEQDEAVTDGEAAAPADDTEQYVLKDATDPVVLKVCVDGVEQKSFKKSEIIAHAKETHTYSAFNAFPTPDLLIDVKGVTLTSLLKEARVDLAAVGDNQIIDVVSSDGVCESFLKGQLFADRYCFPNVMNEAGRHGKAPLDTSWDNSTRVPAMFTVDESDFDSDSSRRFVFGQITPTEQNKSAFLKYVLKVDSETGNCGKINIHSESAGQWRAIQKTNPANGSLLKKGTSITFDRTVNNDPIMFTDRYCIYYTMDGSEPTVSSAIYNYNNYNFNTKYEKFNKPIIPIEGSVTIKTKVIGYGMQDSEVSTFSYTGYQPPAAPTISKIKAKKKTITLQWTKVSNAKGYRIYRATKKSGPYKLVKSIASNSTLKWTNKKLKKKKTYYYKICAYRTAFGKTVTGGYSAVKYKKIK